MTMSEKIALMIEDMLNEGGGAVMVQRNVLAERLGCVPSQINYVITSRFTPERGYVIESRRGGGGYIRIVKKQMGRNDYLMHFFHAVGKELTADDAVAYTENLYGSGIIDEREAHIIESAVSTSALSGVEPEARNSLRADIYRHIILSLMN
ncbi:MAG: CtsR family transcriptional regulator [Firmicutes bacterium]|nr:CtsR family transcriptional regulator [Bacillota bacterium]MCD8314915.1 CtsR family transcriptional regulator [Bacillota bacterium]